MDKTNILGRLHHHHHHHHSFIHSFYICQSLYKEHHNEAVKRAKLYLGTVAPNSKTNDIMTTTVTIILIIIIIIIHNRRNMVLPKKITPDIII